MIFAVLATGPSMSQAVADSVRGRCKVIAVSDAYKLAPWADALASTDAKWWKENPESLQFAGRKFTSAPAFQQIEGVEKIASEGVIGTGSNSGLLACHVAVKLGATKIILLGFDMKGSHYFGPHAAPLTNTNPDRFKAFKLQFSKYRPQGVEIINCTTNSSLRCYPFKSLESALC